MKALLVVDSGGPNPDFLPPDPRQDEAAYYRYVRAVPHTITIPAGTVLDGNQVHVHCLPDAEGVVRAVPYDEDCQLLVDLERKNLNPKAEIAMRRFLQEAPALVQAAEAKAANRAIREPAGKGVPGG